MDKPARPSHQAPGVHHKTIGELTVTALNDGMFEGSFEFLVNLPNEESERLYRESFRAIPPRLAVNNFLIQSPDRLILVDGGCGGVMGPELGKLAGNLAVLGVRPEQIDTILCTHLHPDHVGGLIDAEGAAVFPNAELVLHEADLRFWGDDATLAGATTDQERQFVQLAQVAIAAYRGKTRSLAGGEAVAGITLVPEPGHTPGHSGWMIASGNDTLLIWGDIVHMPGVQFARPGAAMGFDVDPNQAVATRRRIMDMVTTDRLLIAGMHLDFPCFGHVVRATDGYAFIADVWTPTL